MNEEELKRNPVLTEWVVKDLNGGESFMILPHCRPSQILQFWTMMQKKWGCLPRK